MQHWKEKVYNVININFGWVWKFASLVKSTSKHHKRAFTHCHLIAIDWKWFQQLATYNINNIISTFLKVFNTNGHPSLHNPNVTIEIGYRKQLKLQGRGSGRLQTVRSVPEPEPWRDFRVKIVTNLSSELCRGTIQKKKLLTRMSRNTFQLCLRKKSEKCTTCDIVILQTLLLLHKKDSFRK